MDVLIIKVKKVLKKKEVKKVKFINARLRTKTICNRSPECLSCPKNLFKKTFCKYCQNTNNLDFLCHKETANVKYKII